MLTVGPFIGYVCVLSCLSHVWLFATLWTVACQALCPWDSPGKNTRVGCCVLPKGIFPPRDWTHVFYIFSIDRLFFATSATWEALYRLRILSAISNCHTNAVHALQAVDLKQAVIHVMSSYTLTTSLGQVFI